MYDISRKERLNSWTRGTVIAVLIVGYGWLVGYPQGTATGLFVAGVVVQLLVILVRKLLPANVRPQAQDIFELLADGVTVLVFALGVFGAIARISVNA